MLRDMNWILRFLILIVLFAVGFAAYSFHIYRSPSVAADTTVFIERGTGGRAAIAQLHREKVLPAPWKIMLPLALSGDYRSFKAGEYEFGKDLAPQQVIQSIVKGEVVIHAVTIPEGYTVAQARSVLMAEPLLQGELPVDIKEGSLATDTVHFHRGEARSAIVARLQQQQNDILEEAWGKRADNVAVGTSEELLILASIVEEETGIDAERRRVAAVYSNRLRLGMPLQADPTVAYGITRGTKNRILSRADLKRNTPYNTYIHGGLPPGPICNPGRASIEAAANPLTSNEIYFVATGNGGHLFAETAKQHEANVVKYRAWQREQRAKR